MPESSQLDTETFLRAAALLDDAVLRTELVTLSKVLLPQGVRLSLKLECHQRSGSFKARGARHFLARLLQQGTPAGVITYSSGNHGRAVAEAARDLGLPALVTVPDHVDLSKASAMERAGAEVVRAGTTSLSRYRRARELATERGWEIVPPFDHPWIVAGQGTVALEIAEQAPDVVGVWVPVGGGGLASGVATAMRGVRPEVQVHTVEPVSAAALAASLAAGERVTLDSCDSVADGLLPLTVGELNFDLLQQAGVVAVTVDESEILDSLRQLRLTHGVAAEPSGAVAAAPLLTGAYRRFVENLTPGHHVAVVSGGNVDEERLQRLLS